MEKILLVDGNSILNRAFYGLPILTNKDGIYTNAVYGFLNILLKFIEEEKPEYIGVAFDLPAPTFRHVQFPEYKGTRKGMPDELRPQFPIVKEILAAMDIAIFELEGFEADDVLGTLAKEFEQRGIMPVIVSGDRDLLQLASDNIKIRIPKTKGGKTEVEDYFQQDVLEKLGVSPSEYIDVKGLMGDTSDNIPGVPSIGEKTATKIIQEFKTIENALENIDKIKPNRAKENLEQYRDQAILSKELATIKIDVAMDYKESDLKLTDVFNKEAYDLIRKYDFKTLFKRFEAENNAIAQQNILSHTKVDNPFDGEEALAEILKADIMSFSTLEEAGAFYGVAVSVDGKNFVFMADDTFTEPEIFSYITQILTAPIKKISLDSKKELTFYEKRGIIIQNIVFDSLLAGYILNPSKTGYLASDLALEFLGQHNSGLEELVGKGKSKVSLKDIDDDKKVDYIVNESHVAYDTYSIMNKELEERGQFDLYYNVELPLVSVLKDMEMSGIKVDRDGLVAYGEKLKTEIDILQTEIYTLAGDEDFNINSPSQLGVILFEKLGLKSGKKTKTGFSTSAEVLEKLKFEHPIIDKILKYRTYTKLSSTYVDGMLKLIDPETGKIYSTFNQTITTTGRISSTEPNLQNIPIKLEIGKELRKVFVPTSDEYIFLDGDYSQIELRVLAHMAGDETLIQAFRNGDDIHKLTASQVFKVDFENVTSRQRSNAKAVNFGIVYGISAFSLSQDLGITVAEAKRYISGYFEKYPKVKLFLDGLIEDAKESGFATTILGRRRNIPELTSSNFVTRSFGERIAMNMPIQGSAADIIKIAMVNVHRRLKAEGLESRLILQVHDELLLEVKKSELERARDIMVKEMAGAVELSVPLTVDWATGESWYDTK